MSVIINEFEVVNQETQQAAPTTSANAAESRPELSPREVQMIREHQKRRELRVRAH